MIKNFRDHAANERTFLAWIRTAIAIIAFGFIVEKFDLFLEVAAPMLTHRTLWATGQTFGNIAGLALIVLGMMVIIMSTVRFYWAREDMDSEETKPGRWAWINIALAALLLLMGGALFIYLYHTVAVKT
jgi:putative membrane protein